MTRDDVHTLIWACADDIRKLLNGVALAAAPAEIDIIAEKFRAEVSMVEAALCDLKKRVTI